MVHSTIPGYVIGVLTQNFYYDISNSNTNNLSNCINDVDFYAPKSENAFLEEIDGYVEANNYNLSSNENEILARKNIDVNGKEYYVDLMFTSSQGGPLFYVCNMTIRNVDNTIYISNYIENTLIITYDDLVRGEVDLKTNNIYLYTEKCIKDCENLTCHGDECDEFIEKKDYDIEKDEYEIMNLIYNLRDIYIDELNLLKKQLG
ncbi:MAG: hypothetical protein ACK5K7_00415 [Bacilli bacterium]